MTIFEAIILGVIEGLTEFFPVSSTGHLIIAEKFLGIHNPSLFFNTVIQLGAIAALFVVYGKEIFSMIKQVCAKKYDRIGHLLFATIPVLVVGMIFHKTIAQLHNSIFTVAVTSILVALIMYINQKKFANTLQNGKAQSKMSWKDALIIGIYQIISLIPGTSRSGITVVGGIARGYSFKNATEFAFLLGIPAMGAASVFELLSLMKAPGLIDQNLIVSTCIGFVVAFLVSIATIKATLPIFQKYKFTPFIIYRVVLGIILLLFFR